MPPPPHNAHFHDEAWSLIDAWPGRRDSKARAFAIAQYDGAIAFLDAELERLLRHLRRLGRYDETLLVVTSDHGELFGEHGLVGHGRALYEPLLRVPLVIRIPGQRDGKRVIQRVGLQDVSSMIRGILDGRRRIEDLVPTNPAEPRILAEHWTSVLDLERARSRSVAPYFRAAYAGRHKLIQAANGQDELYDLENDPDEERNLLAVPGNEALRASITAALPSLPATSAPATVPLDPEALARLRALGYLR